jgi:uncharacterized delta-60 repeat protein
LTGTDSAIFRWNADGSVDTSFGGGDGYTLANTRGSVPELALQGNGKIVAAVGVNSLFTVLRLDANGDLDPTFGGGDGIVAEQYGHVPYDWARAIAIQGDGHVVAAGYTTPASGIGSDILLARYEGDGTLGAPPPQSGQGQQTGVAAPPTPASQTPADDGNVSTGGNEGNDGDGDDTNGSTDGDETPDGNTTSGGGPETQSTPFATAPTTDVFGKDNDLFDRAEDLILT